MSVFVLSNQIDNNKIFLTNLSAIEGRLDAFFYKKEFLELITFIRKHPNSRTLRSLKAYIKKGVFDMNPENYVKKGIPFLRVADITYEGMDFTSTVFISEKTHSKEIKTEFLPGDIVIAKIGHTIGKVSILPETFERYNISQNVVGIKISEELKKRILPEYLKLYLTSIFGKKQVIRQSTHGAQPKITLDALRGIIIPIIDLSVQKELIKLYDTALISKQQKEVSAIELLESIDEYLLNELGISLPIKDNSLQNRIFTTSLSKVSGGRLDPFYNDIVYLEIDKQIENCNFETIRIKDLCYYVSGVVYSAKDERNEGKAILRANNITLKTNELNFDDIRYIDGNLEIPDKLLLKQNDILLSSASGSKEHVGKVAFINTDMQYYFGGFMGVLRQLNLNHNQRYLFEYLQSKLFRAYLFKNLGGTNINNLNFNMISRLKVPLPSIEKQNEIASYINQIREQVKTLQTQANEEFELTKQNIEQIILGKQ